MSNIKKASNAVKFFVEQFGTFRVDEKNQILWSSDLSELKVTVKETKKPVYIVGETLPNGNDYWVYNPFFGAVMATNVDKLFYAAHRNTFNMILHKMILSIVYTGLLQKEVKLGDIDISDAIELPSNKTLINILGKTVDGLKGKLIDELDEKVLVELNKYFSYNEENITELTVIKYTKTDISSKLLVNVLSDEFLTEILPVQMRKKTIYVLRAIIKGILNTTNEKLNEDYSVTATDNVPFRFWTTMSVYFKLHKQLNLLLVGYEKIEEMYIIDLEEFQHHLDNMIDYKRYVKGFMTTTPPDKVKELENINRSVPPSNREYQRSNRGRESCYSRNETRNDIYQRQHPETRREAGRETYKVGRESCYSRRGRVPENSRVPQTGRRSCY